MDRRITPKIGEESWHNFSYLYREPASLVAFLRFNRFACIACFNFIASVDKLRIFINSANFANKYARISLTLQKSPDRRCDSSRRKHCCRHPIEQGLKEVMIRSITTTRSAFARLRALAAASPARPAPIITTLFIHCLIHAARLRGGFAT